METTVRYFQPKTDLGDLHAAVRKASPSDGGNGGCRDSAGVTGESGCPSCKARDNGYLILEADCYDKLAFSFPSWKKWTILTVLFGVQISMNFNASIYANAIMPLSSQFSISEQDARVGEMIFLIAYALGSGLWARWSEALGRWPTMQGS